MKIDCKSKKKKSIKNIFMIRMNFLGNILPSSSYAHLFYKKCTFQKYTQCKKKADSKKRCLWFTNRKKLCKIIRITHIYYLDFIRLLLFIVLFFRRQLYVWRSWILILKLKVNKISTINCLECFGKTFLWPAHFYCAIVRVLNIQYIEKIIRRKCYTFMNTKN